MGSFKDRVVLIESVGDDIAYAIARMAASKGAKLALLDIDGKKTSDTVARLKQDGVDALGITADSADCTGVKQAIGNIVEKYGRIDVLINNSDFLWKTILWKLRHRGGIRGPKTILILLFFYAGK